MIDSNFVCGMERGLEEEAVGVYLLVEDEIFLSSTMDEHLRFLSSLVASVALFVMLLAPQSVLARDSMADQRECPIHVWPSAVLDASVDPLIGPSMFDSLFGAGRPLSDISEMLRSDINEESQFKIIQDQDFSALIGGDSPTFVLERASFDPMSLKKKSPALRPHSGNCYVEVIVVGVRLRLHKIYGVTVNTAAIVRVYNEGELPKLAVLTGGASKINKGMRMVYDSDHALPAAVRWHLSESIKAIILSAASQFSK